MRLRSRTNKVWVVYAYDPVGKLWDEITYSIHYRNLRYLFRKNLFTESMFHHGYTKFVLVRRNINSLWAYSKDMSYSNYFTTDRVRDLLKRLAKYERAITHTNRHTS